MKHTILVFASLLVAFVASAEYSDLYILPVAAHTRGAHGTLWRSEVVLHNIQMTQVTVEMALIESGRSPSADAIPIGVGAEMSIRLLPGETRIISDVLGEQGRDLFGALIVGAEMPFALTSRTYAETSDGATLGQSVVPVPIAGGADAVADLAILAGLSGSSPRRSNIGFFIAASHAPLIAEIDLVSVEGTALGSRVIEVGEEGFIHQQLSSAEITSASGPITAVIRIVEGDGVVVPYASTIVNATGEAMFASAPPVGKRSQNAAAMLRNAVHRDEMN